MLQPSYTDLMDVLNKQGLDDDKPIVTSRYSVVIAAAKRARQLIDGQEPLVKSKLPKPLSIAVEEIYHGKVIITPIDNKSIEQSINEQILDI